MAVVLVFAGIASLVGLHTQVFDGQTATVVSSIPSKPVARTAVVIPYTSGEPTASVDEIRGFLSENAQNVTDHFIEEGVAYQFEIRDWTEYEGFADGCSQETLFDEVNALQVDTDGYDVAIFMIPPREACRWDALTLSEQNTVFVQLASGSPFNWNTLASALAPITFEERDSFRYTVYGSDPEVGEPPRGERSLQDILADRGIARGVNTDSTGRQTWAACAGETTIEAEVLAVQSRNKNKFGYILNGETFEILLNPPGRWTGQGNRAREVSTALTLSTTGDDTLAFAVNTGLRTFSTATRSNPNGMDLAVTYQVSSSTAVIGFEDSHSYADNDFNDLVAQVTIRCEAGEEEEEPAGPSNGRGGGFQLDPNG